MDKGEKEPIKTITRTITTTKKIKQMSKVENNKMTIQKSPDKNLAIRI